MLFQLSQSSMVRGSFFLTGSATFLYSLDSSMY